MKPKRTEIFFTLILSLFFTLFYNWTFFSKTLKVYPLGPHNGFYLLTLFIILTLAINLILHLVLFILNSITRLFSTKSFEHYFFLLIQFFAMSAAYVMDSYGTVIDETMLLNILKTDLKEFRDLMTLKFFIYFIFLFAFPGIIFLKSHCFKIKTIQKEFVLRIKAIGISLLIIFLLLISSGKFYASFFREQKPLRYYTNPTYWIYSIGKFTSRYFKNANKKFIVIGKGSYIPSEDNDRDLVILVVGETARRDRFSLNGHNKLTNPLLAKEKVVSFTNATSCGTSTAISVPCMFSNFGRNKFSVENASYTENLLDILVHTKNVNVLWRDNNSNSKGVADRIKFEDYKSPNLNTICDPECRDEGMLVGLQEYVNQVKEKDILIVLHQMGNHGPAYYKRYPKAFEVHQPVCQTSELAKCTNEEIGNAYDNAILYTDYFLAKAIAFLKENSTKFHTKLLYVSDHGESLGENGIYLHGLPYMMAPKEQIEIGLIFWAGESAEGEIDYALAKKVINEPFSHDNIFHTVLGMFEVQTPLYDEKKDILKKN